ncbi:MAG: hypothetical protein EOQ55_10345 [Mesorhizobium sp.]|uniref:hypothetical protein n=1 Tax=unclassified Mesorhizobium TaxID=325217 RepID=UPI000FCAD19B|nr:MULTISPECIES: hypothetical protein [unclassified Mesorhizobium]RUV45894.1 hypothetical protein EOD29_03460 [Mesorhizobium sp. M1A.T.Ca.IN.004.03.1.1]RWG20681.1 MAG: hypothetical protein EOQ55_10345 [Mesorhizobium sp.]RWI98405.1 MAG: hypothetical protein EOR21_04980 [Mesorhizobium sp.]RWK36059.1 MAG: hypothetical protein EOR40_14260 [Mesorhizobium sp.]RWK88001.1 MAG: hypothetical protein EOR52_15260 [Mesorhizobium sp.]
MARTAILNELASNHGWDAAGNAEIVDAALGFLDRVGQWSRLALFVPYGRSVGAVINLTVT